MNPVGILPPPAKTCVWLECIDLSVPMETLKTTLTAEVKCPVKIGFLEDKFQVHISKINDFYIRVAVYRNRVNPNKEHDDGYVLQFYISMIGFDEEPQVSIMEHDDEKAKPVAFFKLSENILAKINSTHYVFDVFMVAEMLEFKSVPEENELKKIIDNYMSSCFKSKLSKKEFEDLCYILKYSTLDDGFTGRLPLPYMTKMMAIITTMSQNYAKIVEYIKGNCTYENSEDPDADVSSVLKYADLEDERGPLPLEEACDRYLLAHKIGFHCLEIIASDYLLSFLGKDYDNVLNVLEVALAVHDETLFEEAIFSFLNSFHEIIRSKKFEYYSNNKPPITRLIIHSARVWITNNDVYIPNWKQPA